LTGTGSRRRNGRMRQPSRFRGVAENKCSGPMPKRHSTPYCFIAIGFERGFF
jgi:hypothetical protein